MTSDQRAGDGDMADPYIDPTDLRIDTFESGDYVVRITHVPTGLVGESDPYKSMIRAREQALTRLREAMRNG